MSAVAAFEAHFETVTERMVDLPMFNPALRVATVGFHQFQRRLIGVQITPWCMNILLLPAVDEHWSAQLQGQKQIIRLPSGPYEFIYAWHQSLGGYGSCSLFSSMVEFETQEAARETACEVMKVLFNAADVSGPDRQAAAKAKPLVSEGSVDWGLQAQQLQQRIKGAGRQGAATELPRRPLSRRAFLTAGVFERHGR